MEELPEAVVEIREEVMVPPGGGKSTKRLAHFLKPSVTSIDGPVFEIPPQSLSSSPATFEPKQWPLKVSFKGWRLPQKGWQTWVEKMAALHESTWIKAGVKEAILNSQYKIQRKNDFLVLGLAEKWCNETKSFIFPWGEATITMEDMIVYGYSVLGSPPFGKAEEIEEKAVEKLEMARRELLKSPSRKAEHRSWKKKFMDSGIDIEHEAFLALWLSRFVFPSKFSVMDRSVFPVAVKLARGTRIALAPAVLASIYRDLGKLKDNIFALAKLDGCNKNINLDIVVWAPFQLVQVWAWERFVELRPTPNVMKRGEPRFALWHEKNYGAKNARTVLNLAKEDFDWRPYVRPMKNWNFPGFYLKNEMWVPVDPSLSKELESFARCLRVSRLVGLDCDEEYFPHRVAMQFGFDQDLPALVALANETLEKAWIDYCAPFSYSEFYVPSQDFEADVTARYLEWWKKSVSCLKCASVDGDNLSLKTILMKSRRPIKRSRVEEGSSFGKAKKSQNATKEDDDSSSFNSEPREFKETNARNYNTFQVQPKESNAMRRYINASIDHDSLKKPKKSEENPKVKREHDEVVSTNVKAMMEANDSIVPPGFLPKSNLMVGKDSSDEDGMTIADLLKSKKHGDFGIAHVSGDELSSSAASSKTETLMEDVNLDGARSPRDDVMDLEGSKGEEGSVEEDVDVVMVETRLEDRVSRLDKMIAERKALRFGHLLASS